MFTVNSFVPVTVSLPVVTTTFLGPKAADAPIAILQVKFVPSDDATILLTVIPVPRSTVVELPKCVFAPTIFAPVNVDP